MQSLVKSCKRILKRKKKKKNPRQIPARLAQLKPSAVCGGKDIYMQAGSSSQVPFIRLLTHVAAGPHAAVDEGRKDDGEKDR